MKQLILTKGVYRFILEECSAFEKRTGHDVGVQDVLFSFLYSTDDTFHILNDWDEGENNDPFWDKERNEHSVIVFLKVMVEKLNSI